MITILIINNLINFLTMKRLFYSIAVLMFMCATAFSQNKNLNVTTKESDDDYEFSAVFDKAKNPEVVSYMDKVLGKPNNISFSNTQLDAKMSLDDKSKFYIKLSPGNIKMKFSKEDNSEANYKKLKNMCENLSKIVHEKGN